MKFEVVAIVFKAGKTSMDVMPVGTSSARNRICNVYRPALVNVTDTKYTPGSLSSVMAASTIIGRNSMTESSSIKAYFML